MTKHLPRLVAMAALLLCADACKSQTILGKHPADKVLLGFWNQNTNADSTILGLGLYGTVPWNLANATITSANIASASIGSLTLGGQTRTTWPATGWLAMPAAASGTNLVLWLDPSAGGQTGLSLTYQNGNTALFWANAGSFFFNAPDGNQLLFYSAGGVGADQWELLRDGGRPVLNASSLGLFLYDETGSQQVSIAHAGTSISGNVAVAGVVSAGGVQLANTNLASPTAAGLFQKLPNDNTKVLDGTGAFVPISNLAVGSLVGTIAGPVSVTAVASPWNFTNTTSAAQTVWIQGGTVSNIAIDGVSTFSSSGQVVPSLHPGEWVTITYTGSPPLMFRKQL